MVGVDVGFENPLFAALEVDYGEADQDPTGEAFNAAEKVGVAAKGSETTANEVWMQMLTYYELDLGLNHVVRKWSEATDPRANLLVQGTSFHSFGCIDTDVVPLTVPGGQSSSSEKFDGPSGVLVCAEDYIIYKHQGAKEHRVPIPKRAHPLSDPDRGLIITSAVMHKMRVRPSHLRRLIPR